MYSFVDYAEKKICVVKKKKGRRSESPTCLLPSVQIHEDTDLTLQVYLPYFVTDNLFTSHRVEHALQHHALQVIAGLPPALQPQVHERFLDAPRSFGENGEVPGAIYCVFVTATHVDP